MATKRRKKKRQSSPLKGRDGNYPTGDLPKLPQSVLREIAERRGRGITPAEYELLKAEPARTFRKVKAAKDWPDADERIESSSATFQLATGIFDDLGKRAIEQSKAASKNAKKPRFRAPTYAIDAVLRNYPPEPGPTWREVWDELSGHSDQNVAIAEEVNEVGEKYLEFTFLTRLNESGEPRFGRWSVQSFKTAVSRAKKRRRVAK